MSKKDGLQVKRFWLPLFLFAVAVILFYKTVDKLPAVFGSIMDFVRILSPFIVGAVVAFILYKPANKLEGFLIKRKSKFFSKHARGFSVLICYVVMLLIVAAVLYLVLPRLFNSIVSLVNHIPGYYDSLMQYIKSLSGEDGKLLGFDITSIQKQLSPSVILSYFDIGTITKYAEGIFKATGAIVDVSMALVVSIYMLLGREHLIRVCGKLIGLALPHRRVQQLYAYLVRVCDIFYNYIYSQLIDAVIVTVLCFIVFSIFGIPYALLLAILMGVCNLIPYFGAIIGGAGVVFVTLISTGNFVRALVALACVIGSQQLDANVLQPKIVAGSVGIRPIYVLLAITIGGGLFGFIGILIGVPIMAVIRMLILDYMEYRKTSPGHLLDRMEQADEGNPAAPSDGVKKE